MTTQAIIYLKSCLAYKSSEGPAQLWIDAAWKLIASLYIKQTIWGASKWLLDITMLLYRWNCRWPLCLIDTICPSKLLISSYQSLLIIPAKCAGGSTRAHFGHSPAQPDGLFVTSPHHRRYSTISLTTNGRLRQSFIAFLAINIYRAKMAGFLRFDYFKRDEISLGIHQQTTVHLMFHRDTEFSLKVTKSA